MVGWFFRSAPCGVITFIAGTMIDIDHFLDFYLHQPFTLNLKKIYAAHESRVLPKAYIILHSYELFAALWLAIYFFSLGRYWQAAAIGFTQHFILDIITNPVHTLGYFLTYRAIKKFRSDLILKEKD